MPEVAIVEAPPPAPPPSPKTEIHVTPTAIETGPAAAPPERGSPRDQFNKRLRARVKPQFFEQKEETGAKVVASPQENPPPEPTAASATPSEAATPKPEVKEKKNPWKLVDEYKARASKAEQELVEARNSGLNPNERKSIDETMAALKKQNEELENEIRHVNYAKSAEYKTKYQEPYEKAWNRAVKELTQISVTDRGTSRKAEVGDLSALVSMNINDARDYADNTFGKFADDAMGYRKEILGLWEAQETALTEAKEKGGTREKERAAAMQQYQQQTGGQIKSFWEKSNQGFLADKDLGPLFSPVEGDQDGNQRLAKGFELVDRAFSENPSDPNLTPEQREVIVKRHAAVRMRAAAFGRLRAQYQSLQAKYEKLEKEVGQYKASVPGTGGRTAPAANGGQPSSAWDSLRGRLREKAAK